MQSYEEMQRRAIA